jgi:hypothetical protein
MWSTLLEQLVAILAANTLIQEVYAYEVEEFTGDPAVTIFPSQNQSEYNTTQENVRIYAFSLFVYTNRTKAAAGKDAKVEAERRMRNLVDSILDDFDRNYVLPSLVNPTGYTFINLFATPSAWGYSGRESEFRVAEITIQARVSVDLSNIS